MSGVSLDARFRAHLDATGWLEGATAVVVGVSGGLDSMTLLHLVRFGGVDPILPVHAAHLDHRMRTGSGADARWVESVCAGWGVSFHLRPAAEPVSSEAEGRELRYAFFNEIGRRLGAGTVAMTGHTADDQAETVLFRIARGSGPRGLGGVHPERTPALVRPLLPFWRGELEAYATACGIPSREDPSNRNPRWTRNRLRRDILPALEAAVPGAAAALASLADTSRLESAALDELLDRRLAALATPASAPGLPAPAPPPPPAFSLDREALCAASDPVVTLLLRRAVARLGGRPGRRATGQLLRFVRESASGRHLAVAGGVTVEHRLGVLRIRRTETLDSMATGDRPVSLPAAVRIGAEPGEGAFATGNWKVKVAWGPVLRHGFPHVAQFPPGGIQFPLSLRPWRPGDRMAMPYGKKKVKKILLEARIPADRRPGFPVLADAAGTVLWIPGVAGPHAPAPESCGRAPCQVEVRLDPEGDPA